MLIVLLLEYIGKVDGNERNSRGYKVSFQFKIFDFKKTSTRGSGLSDLG